MSRFLLKPFASSSGNSLLLVSPPCSLNSQLLLQLQSYPRLRLMHCTTVDEIPTTLTDLSAAVFLINFGPRSLEQSLFATTHLYPLLQLAVSNRAKVVLVLNQPYSPLSKTAALLTGQFAKNMHLEYDIVEADPTLPESQIAAGIIKKFIYGHRPHLLLLLFPLWFIPVALVATPFPFFSELFSWSPLFRLYRFLLTGLFLIALLSPTVYPIFPLPAIVPALFFWLPTPPPSLCLSV